MFKKLLVPLDGSPLAEQALDIAAEIAHASHATMDLVLVHQPLTFMGLRGDERLNIEQRIAEERYLASIVAEMKRDQHVAASHIVHVGHPADMISARAHDVGADLIVMTSHGRTGISRAWLGSVADGVVRASKLPVLMLRPAAGQLPRGNVRPVLRRIVVPLDGSPLSASILDIASNLAQCLKARVLLFRVVQPVPTIGANPTTELAHPLAVHDEAATRLVTDAAAQELAEFRRGIMRLGCTDVESQVVVATNVAQEIVDFAQNHDGDVIAMSTQGRGASRLVVGSVADKVLRGSKIPVLLSRPASASAEVEPLAPEAIELALPALSGL